MQSIEYKEGVVISATELKQNLGKYLDFVEELNDVVITKNGNKIARVTPYVTDIEQYFTVRENALDYQYGGKKVSYEEFMEIYEKSTLRMELISGEIYLLASPSIEHQEVLGGLYLIFREYFTYRLSGVKECWVIDSKQEKILVYEFNGCEIDEFQVYGKGDMAQSIVFNGLSADSKELFDVTR